MKASFDFVRIFKFIWFQQIHKSRVTENEEECENSLFEFLRYLSGFHNKLLIIMLIRIWGFFNKLNKNEELRRKKKRVLST